jgi:hypothetical protein
MQSTNTITPERAMFPFSEFCARHSLGKDAGYNEVRSGRLRTFLVGGRRFVSAEAAAEWRAAVEAAPAPIASDRVEAAVAARRVRFTPKAGAEVRS